MNRKIVQCAHFGNRNLDPRASDYYEQLVRWTDALVNKTAAVDKGHVFEWEREGVVDRNTAYLYDAVMCNVQYAQTKLNTAAASTGKAAFRAATEAAQTYQYVLSDLLPLWTFRPSSTLPDTKHADIYGHYCLARATAYGAVGTADLSCTDSAGIAAHSNAAHLYLIAAQLIPGDVSAMLNKAQKHVADCLCLHGKELLERWEADEDSEGACKALACYTEAHSMYVNAGYPSCEDRVQYAYDRNQVHYMPAKLPPFADLMKPRVSSIPRQSR